MKSYINDYRDLVWNPQIQFLRKHWLGTLLVSVAAGVVTAGVQLAKNEIETRNAYRRYYEKHKEE